jgi:hypothetical protein
VASRRPGSAWNQFYIGPLTYELLHRHWAGRVSGSPNHNLGLLGLRGTEASQHENDNKPYQACLIHFAPRLTTASTAKATVNRL